jgi:thiol-disulfide isomerase/thioredoxin
MTRRLALVALVLAFVSTNIQAADLVRFVRSKISAGDLLTGAALVEDHKKATGVDAEYLDAIGWLARGSQMLGRNDLAQQYVAELRREIPAEKEELLTPYGAAIEVESRMIAAREGRGSAIRYLNNELARAKAVALRSRISKNINLLSMEGQPAPAIESVALNGKPTLLFFFAQWCGDCKAQSPSLARVWQKYRAQGLGLVAVTRLYGTVAEKPATPEEEKAQVDKVWKEVYSGLDGAQVVINTAAMERYGVSATPTFALVDRKGIVRLYTPTRLSEAEMSRRIEEVLAAD